MSEYTAPAGLASWLECLFYFCAMVAAVAVSIRFIFFNNSGKARLATHEELTQLRNEFEHSQGAMAKQIERLGVENEQRTRRLHERIEELPAKIILLLKQTKGLL